MVRLVEESGTQWPVPVSWKETSEGIFEGAEGLLKLSLEDGDLIDPARCRVGEALRPAGWELVRTVNGTAITGTYEETGARVVVFSVRVDREGQGGSDALGLPEVQATYVLVGSAEAVVAAVHESLKRVPIHSSEFGLLDSNGHAAMGPVPFLREWQPVGDAIDNSGRLGSPTLGGAFQMLIGGGWLMFSDASRCCGVNLAPLPWRALDDLRARRQLEHQLGPKGFAARLQSDRGARAWQCSVSDRGLSYSVHDSSDNRVGLEAFWFDQFGQAWRLTYWLHSREHGRAAELRLKECCSSVTGA